MISARQLGRRFGAFVAVEGLDLEIAEGEVFGLLGPNGAGKTTTVRMLSGVIAPSSGVATVAGYDVVRDAASVRANVGILTETPGLYVRLDAVENLRFYADLHGVRDAAAKIRAVLERLDLWPRRLEPVGGWSKGMRQRLAIARAVLHDPKVLFLDEPTSALDPVAARNVRELVTELREEGRTIVLCTHNLDEAERLCDRIGVLKTRLLRMDTPSRMVRHPASAQTIVRLASPSDGDLAAAVRALPFVRDAVLEGDRLRVSIDDPEVHVPELVRVLVGAGAAIRGVEDELRTLEQVYVDLVGAPESMEELPR
jgi:ABC-2 type transport system ATP-binding protein